MTWIKIDDKTPRHPKIAGLSHLAFRTWIDSLCYASEFLTNGFLPRSFLRNVRESVKGELIAAGLWIIRVDGWVDIHDYLEHQTSRESVQKERDRNRKRRGGSTGGTSHGTPNWSTNGNPRPEAEADTEVPTEYRRQKQQSGTPPLIVSPMAYERRKAQCAYVGARLEVPHGLHADLRKMLGGANADSDLLAWYADLDEEIERTGETITPDIFRWLKARYALWAQKTGESVEAIVARIEAKQAARKVGVS